MGSNSRTASGAIEISRVGYLCENGYPESGVEAGLPGSSQTAFNVAFNDAYKGPELSNLNTEAYAGNPGNIITVRAIDNFFIDSVRISILDSTRAVLEEGAATPNANGLDFSYTATQANASLVGTTIRTVAEEIKSFNHGTVHIP